MADERTYGFVKSDAIELVNLIGNGDREFQEIRPRGTSKRGDSTIIFQLDEAIYGDDAYGDDETCDGRVEATETSYRAKVMRRPCGSCRVTGEDDDGYVTVVDHAAGGFLSGRTASQLAGMVGFATLMNPDDGCTSYSDCEWIITWINWFQERQFVQDWYVSGTDIITEKANARVWSWCDLGPEITEGVDCADDYAI